MTRQIAAMPGVHAAREDFHDSPAQGMVDFRIDVDVSDQLTGEQAAAMVARYLVGLDSGTFRGYRAELDLRRGWNVFAVDSGDRRIANIDQLVQQARDWVALRHEFPSSTVTLRATIVHPSGPLAVQEQGRSNTASIELPDNADYAAVAAVVSTLSARFAHLAAMEWKVTAGKLHPGQITTTRRFPTAAELDVWNKLNADQSIAHIDALQINGPVTPPVWFSEKTIESRAVALAMQLAERHLPFVATLPAPVLYSASDQLSGHIGGGGYARGPVSVTVGGCTPRDPRVYLPIPAEQALIDRYAKCHR
ncbi:hypothetical protein [Mycolicibacterium sphagni]|uniref:hypothetical protein n=1 Tax=Mycolicibacterium sphagni TaxID=1786 RepID=UPI00105627A9|nr:hypothetical protein [Mycolicibacterium sphagni]